MVVRTLLQLLFFLHLLCGNFLLNPSLLLDHYY
jgi:hypothetical protein